jgi:Zn-dependent protease with chaperone function
MAKLYFASLVTLSLLTAMVAGVVIAALVAAGSLDVGFALFLVLVINAVIFFISPWLTDLMLKWVNQVEFIDDQTLAARYPHVHAIIHDVARDYGFEPPSVGIIPDRNPTAFTYGLFRSGARIVLTEGIFEFLNEEETRAVVAHELGHIVNRDFLVMTVAGTLVQMLYVIYSSFTRRPSGGSSSKSKNNLFIVGVVAYVMYVLGTYILLYLSRTREYLADSFSADRVEARHLANALVKIAYGIAEAADTDQSRELLASTRHLGAVDFKSARHLGLVVEAAKTHPEATANSMLFDIYNPWAKLIELESTHPLTGKRIQALAAIASQKRQAFADIDVEAAATRANVDSAALWAKFWREIGVVVLPVVVAAIVGLWGLTSGTPAYAALAIPAGIFAWLAFIPIIYPSYPPAHETVVDLMGDVAASPVIGRPVRLDGEVIGRVNAGSIFGEDTVFADPSGRINVDFRSLLGPLGDLWTGWRRIKPHINQKGNVTGWFRRGMGGIVIMKELNTTAGRVRAYPYFAGLGTAVFVLVLVGIIAALTTAI